MAKYAKEGHKVCVCTVCDGGTGMTDLPREEIVRIREQEAKEAASILGAISLGTLGFHDHRAYLADELVMKIMGVIREIKPDIIYTHYYNDYNPDHVATSQATWSAVLNASNLGYLTDKPAHGVQRTIYADTIFGLDFEPDFWVDISDTVEMKLKALSRHKSQMTSLPQRSLNLPWKNVVEDARVCAAYRGLQSGVKYAEAFKLVKKSGQNYAFDIPRIS